MDKEKKAIFRILIKLSEKHPESSFCELVKNVCYGAKSPYLDDVLDIKDEDFLMEAFFHLEESKVNSTRQNLNAKVSILK